jgi:type I restriction enzyme, S subunit
MEVKPGYKQTEVGVIPEEWEVKSLGEIGEALIGLTYKPSDVRDYGTLVLRSSNIQNDALSFEDNVFVDTTIPARIMVQTDDVLICVRNGSRDLIGKSALLDERTKGMTFGAFMAVYRSQIGKLVSYLFQSAILKRQINEHLGATINQITNKSLNSFRIPVPPSDKEQREIEEALSDVDGLLGGLDRLIAKKRDLKQAAMQQLLTGQTRLPGLIGRWQPWAISQICAHIMDYRGRTPLKLRMDWGGGDIPALSARNVKMGYIDFREETNFGSEALYQRWMTNGHVRKGDIVITTEAPLGKVALIPDHRRYILSQRTLLLQVEPTIATSSFLMQLMMASRFQNLLFENSSGSTATGIQRKRFEKLELILPEVPEQIAIAEVLTDMDAELATLEHRREKSRALKQAMMQELLTGRTRLVPAGGSHA